MDQGEDGQDRHHNLGAELGVGQAVEREDEVEHYDRRNLKDDLPSDGEGEGVEALADGLEDCDGQKVDAEEGDTKTEAVEEG